MVLMFLWRCPLLKRTLNFPQFIWPITTGGVQPSDRQQRELRMRRQGSCWTWGIYCLEKHQKNQWQSSHTKKNNLGPVMFFFDLQNIMRPSQRVFGLPTWDATPSFAEVKTAASGWTGCACLDVSLALGKSRSKMTGMEWKEMDFVWFRLKSQHLRSIPCFFHFLLGWWIRPSSDWLSLLICFVQGQSGIQSGRPHLHCQAGSSVVKPVAGRLDGGDLPPQVENIGILQRTTTVRTHSVAHWGAYFN